VTSEETEPCEPAFPCSGERIDLLNPMAERLRSNGKYWAVYLDDYGALRALLQLDDALRAMRPWANVSVSEYCSTSGRGCDAKCVRKSTAVGRGSAAPGNGASSRKSASTTDSRQSK
jgi:hypothetical protein